MKLTCPRCQSERVRKMPRQLLIAGEASCVVTLFDGLFYLAVSSLWMAELVMPLTVAALAGLWARGGMRCWCRNCRSSWEILT